MPLGVRGARQNLRDILFDAVAETRTLRRRDTRSVLILLAMLAWRSLCSTDLHGTDSEEHLRGHRVAARERAIRSGFQFDPEAAVHEGRQVLRSDSQFIRSCCATLRRASPDSRRRSSRSTCAGPKRKSPKRKHTCARVRRKDISLKINSRRCGAYPSPL